MTRIPEEAVEAACKSMWTAWEDWSSMRKHSARREMRAALAAALPMLPREGVVDAKRLGDELHAAVYDAALAWCGEKGRETSLADIVYFRNNWRALPGLAAYVDNALGHRIRSALRSGGNGNG